MGIQVPQYNRQVRQTTQSGIVPQSEQQIGLESGQPLIEMGGQIAELGMTISTKLREADHVANYADATTKASSMINDKLNQYKLSPADYSKHPEDFKSFQNDLSTLTQDISDPVSRNNINQSINKMYNQAAVDVNNISLDQQIGVGKAKLNDSMSAAKRSGDTAAFKTLLDEGYRSGFYSPEEYSSMSIAGVRESEINRATGAIVTNPSKAQAVIADPSYQLDPGDKLSLLRLGNSLVAEQEHLQDKAQQARSEEASNQIVDALLSKNIGQAQVLLRRNSRVLSASQRLQFANMIENETQDSMDWDYYNSLVARTLAGEDTKGEILGSRRIPNNRKEHLLQLYSSNAGGKGDNKSRSYSFQTQRMRPFYITTGPLASIVNPQEQVAFANDTASLWRDIAAGEDPEKAADKYIFRYQQLANKPIITIYGPIDSPDDVIRIQNKSLSDYKAGVISAKEFNFIGQSIISYENRARQTQKSTKPSGRK